MMELYQVSLKSKDGNDFIFKCNALNNKEAITLALNDLKDKGWEHFQYTTTDVERINNE